MPKERYNYKSLLKDKNLKRWYDNLKRASPANADKSLQRVGYICRVFCKCGHSNEEHDKRCKKCDCKKVTTLTTEGLASMDTKTAANLILDVLSELESRGKQPTYMQDYVKALKSWFLHNEIRIVQKFRLPRSESSTKAGQEQSPTPDQFRRVLNHADPKQKVECTSVGYAGLREESVGNYLGNDGIKVKDLPEMKVDNNSKTVEFLKIPTMVVVRPNLSKAGHQYFTFMPDEGCTYLKELLEYRMVRKDEVITSDSPIINSIKFNKHPGHIRTNNIGDSMRAAIRKAGFDWRPYILRSYFDTRMMMAEADGLIIRDWRVFWMGHKGDIEHRYTLNKGKLPDDLVEKMRGTFAKAAEKYLVTTIRRDGLTQDAVRAQINRQFLEVAGYSPQELDAMGDLSALSPADVNKLYQERSKIALGLNGNNQKVVPIAQVKQWITEGWEYVTNLPTDEAVIRLPH